MRRPDGDKRDQGDTAAGWTGGCADGTLFSNWKRWLIVTEWLREHPYDPDASELRSWRDQVPTGI